MEFDDLSIGDLSTDIATLRREFDAAAKSSGTLGREARKAFVDIRTESGRATAGSRDFGRIMTNAFGDIIAGGQSLQSILRSLAADLAKLAVENVFSGASGGGFDVSGLFGGGFGGSPGNSAKNSRVSAFAKGGILSSPSLFPMGGGLGLAGEAGPEAILPLARGPDGRLGVATQGEARPISVTFNVTTNDAGSFQRSQSQIAAMLSRTVSRGTRNL